jgi:hypothetical protein
VLAQLVWHYAASIITTLNMKLQIDPVTQERVYPLTCIENGCEVIGGEIRFPENHGRENDEVLEAELNAIYSHICEDHK